MGNEGVSGSTLVLVGETAGVVEVEVEVLEVEEKVRGDDLVLELERFIILARGVLERSLGEPLEERFERCVDGLVSVGVPPVVGDEVVDVTLVVVEGWAVAGPGTSESLGNAALDFEDFGDASVSVLENKTGFRVFGDLADFVGVVALLLLDSGKCVIGALETIPDGRAMDLILLRVSAFGVFVLGA